VPRQAVHAAAAERRAMMRPVTSRLSRARAAAGVALVAAGCNSSNVNLTPSCPASYIQPVALSVAPQSATTSVDLSLTGNYMRSRVRGMVQAPEVDAQGKPTAAGADVKSIDLVEKVVNGQTQRLIAVSLEPWIRGQSGGHTSLNNRYDLRLTINPYIVNKTTVSDAAKRKTFLCGADPQCTTDEGILLGFELQELDNRSQGTVVSTGAGKCGTLNQVDAQVLDGLWGKDGALTKAAPVLLPTASVTQMIGKITGTTATTTGVAIGASGDLKVGILTDQGTPRPFDSTTGFRGDVDWSIDIDDAFISSAVSSVAAAGAAASNPPATITGTTIKFSDQPENTVDATIEATLPICGTARARIRAHVRFDVCTDGGQSVLQMCRADTKELPNNWIVNGCVVADYVFARWPKYGEIIDPPCGLAGTSTALRFPVAANETFYATAMDISQTVFHIDGRSTAMDAAAAAAGHPRPSAPAACNGNFTYTFP
jgi:hypothetical protein